MKISHILFKVDHWNFQYGVGCSHCNCNVVGSNSSECNVFSGQCSCQPGVTGRTCDSCLIGFFNFSNLGCQSKYPTITLQC